MCSSETPTSMRGDQVHGLSNEELQELLAIAVKEYAHRQQAGDRFPVFGADQVHIGLTATDAVIAASAVLDALSVEIFELGMWKTWGGA